MTVDEAELSRAVALEALDRQCSLRISSVDCATPSTIELVVEPLLGARTLTATISLADVPAPFRGRTIAFVAKELLATRPALEPTPKAKPRLVRPRDRARPAKLTLFGAPLTPRPEGWAVTGALGVNLRPTGRRAQLDTLPQAQLAAERALLDLFLLRASLSLERSASILHSHYGARIGLRPSLMLKTERFELSGGFEYRAGAAWTSGKGDGASSSTAFVHAMAGALAVKWLIGASVGLSVDLVVGYEWGIEAFDEGTLVFSSQGLFFNPTMGLAVAF